MPPDRSVLDQCGLTDIAFERGPFGISLNDARAPLFGRHVLTNLAYQAIVGYDADELRTCTFHKIVHCDDHAEVTRGLAGLISGIVETTDAEIKLCRADGDTVWVRQHRALIRTQEDEPLLFLTHTENVTTRRAAELAAIAARHDAEEAECTYGSRPPGSAHGTPSTLWNRRRQEAR